MFLDKGHKKDISIKDHDMSSQLMRFKIQSSDQHMLFIAQKTEKITMALYMITDFLKDKEPFKWQIRDRAVQFLSFINSFKGFVIASQKERAISEMLSLLSELLALLRVAVSVRFISQMNYSILRDEYTSLYETLEDRLKMKQPVDGLILTQDFFESKLKSEEQPLASDNNRQERHENNLDAKSHGVEGATEGEREMSNRKDNISVSADNNEMSYNNSAHIINSNSKKGMRQDIILKLLKARGGVGIKDISETISGCGEKTVQRELAFLVGKGLVRKTGERRWSTYESV